MPTHSQPETELPLPLLRIAGGLITGLAVGMGGMVGISFALRKLLEVWA